LSGLTYLTKNPPNAGVQTAMQDGRLLSQSEMYLRNNFPLPGYPPQGFEVVIPGRRTRFLTGADLLRFPQVELDLVLECAGNGRILMDPVPEGIPWDLGGSSIISAAGVHLADVLGPLPHQVIDVVFTGADRGVVAPEGEIPYQFSIDRDLAGSETPLLISHIGGDPLTLEHGAPVRLVVPGHYAMKSVKWLTMIEGIKAPFRGHFVGKYRYFQDQAEPEGGPVGPIQVRSVISSPADGASVEPGIVEVRGAAWSGIGPVAAVEVSVDGGETWRKAETKPGSGNHSASQWVLRSQVRPGMLALVARATDAAGATQPLGSRWNRNGYANNVAHRVTVHVG
jgi:DMSO/TMAO reductase YedYZ molybdopterin-dependent catalytic subunit